MTQRCLTEDYELRGKLYQLWIEGRDWWLNNEDGTEAEFDPELTEQELQDIWEYINDYFTD